MTALANRMLRHLVSQPGQTSAQIAQAFPAYRTTHVTTTIARLLRLGMVHADQVGALTCTPQGLTVASLAVPARWSGRRQIRSLPRTATIAR